MKKHKKIAAIAMALAVTVTSLPLSPLANGFAETASAKLTQEQKNENKQLDRKGYTLKWEDEFNGTELNRDDWNVELHEPGWVNKELQAYVDSDENISVHDGKLYLTPKKNASNSNNLLTNVEFSRSDSSKYLNWTETDPAWCKNASSFTSATTVENGATVIKYNIAKPGTDGWHVQLKQEKVPLKTGRKYILSFDIESTQDWFVQAGAQQPETYASYGDKVIKLAANTPENVSITIDNVTGNDDAIVYFTMGKVESNEGKTELSISNISLKEISEDAPEYTSGRINTQNKRTFTYGLFEVRAKVPAGKGYLPAFWLMANDENLYGQWPRCGEIDCMEVMGQKPDKVYGTIHYGNPHSESQDTYVTTTGKDFSKDFHTFSCEWEPGRIRWYCDGTLYHEEDDWYSTTEGKGTLSYPAPFDQPFYMILNLAVGGSWVGNPDNTTNFENNPYIIDYVKVYQKDQSVYDAAENSAVKPERPVDLRDPDANGNYINNGDFAKAENLTDDTDWAFKTALEGEGSAEIANNEMKITTTSEGTVDYSIQLVQAGVPLEKGASYKVSFQAKADSPRVMGVDIKAPDHGYKTYMPSLNAELTTEYQTFEQEFRMNDSSDANGRLEYNMGKKGSTATIYIKDVKIEKTADPDPNYKEPKTVLSNGNYVYNGEFQEGTGKLGDWEFTNKDKANVSVTSLTDNRRLQVKLNGTDSLSIFQKDLAFKSGASYSLTFNADADTARNLAVTVGGQTYNVPISSEPNKKYEIKIPASTVFSNQDIVFIFGKDGTFHLDNVMLAEDALIKNGSFNNGLTNYTSYIAEGADAAIVVDSLKEANALDVTINKTADADYKVQVKQENIPLKKGTKYTLSFKAKSSYDRKIRVIMQGGESLNWPVYSSDNIVNLTSEYQTFTDTFIMEKDTDPAAFLSICLGKIDEEINTQHRVVIDDISLVEVTETKPDPDSGNNSSSTSSSSSSSGSSGGGNAADTVTPVPTPAAAATPTATETPVPAATEIPTASKKPKTEVVVDKKTAAKLVITTSEDGTVEINYTGTTDKKAKTIVIPDKIVIDGVSYPVTKIADNAFKNNKKVREIVVNDNIVEIGKNAFANCVKLKTIKIGKNVTTINANAFKNCSSLEVLLISSKKLNGKNINADAFKNINKNVIIKVPATKLKEYKALFTKKGLNTKVKVAALKKK